MREVADQRNLAHLQFEQRGFILNLRLDQPKLHRSGCEAVGAMSRQAYKKIFFEDVTEARTWADSNAAGWQPCGKCHPLSS